MNWLRKNKSLLFAPGAAILGSLIYQTITLRKLPIKAILIMLGIYALFVFFIWVVDKIRGR